MKSSILTSPYAPQFPNSKWANVIIRAMVTLNHVLSGTFAVSNNNRDVEVIGGIQFKFGAARVAKQVKTSGDWFIAWNMYSKVVMFAFPHRQNKLQYCSQSILGLFSATSVEHHSNILLFDKAVPCLCRGTTRPPHQFFQIRGLAALLAQPNWCG